jgi:hypothetical protein
VAELLLAFSIPLLSLTPTYHRSDRLFLFARVEPSLSIAFCSDSKRSILTVCMVRFHLAMVRFLQHTGAALKRFYQGDAQRERFLKKVLLLGVLNNQIVTNGVFGLKNQ